MTTLSFAKKTCFICKSIGRYAEGGMHAVGTSQDLDGRAGDASRSSIYMIIKRCISCGYCSADISSGPPAAPDIIKRADYVLQLNNKEYPDTANSFLCQALIHEHAGNYRDAGNASLCAAWVCDDSGDHREKAAECRKTALRFFQKAGDAHQDSGKSEFDDDLLYIELYRRSAQFKEAAALCKKALKKKCSEKEKLILYYEEDLVSQKDSRRHTIKEATMT